jgi:hypothetical protein
VSQAEELGFIDRKGLEESRNKNQKWFVPLTLGRLR